MNTSPNAWPRNTLEGRWCSFGPYYAMFPVSFVKEAIEYFSPINGLVLDPFCGRGTVPFVAQALGRYGIGVETNPVGWLFSNVKTSPYEDPDHLIKRVRELCRGISPEDRKPEHDFQAWAWSKEVLGFLKAARRELDWRENKLDQTLMALILVHLHAKRGEGLSNQLRQSKAMSPEYAVRWWKDKNMRPPSVDVERFFIDKLAWRYKFGVPHSNNADIFLGDARDKLRENRIGEADFILTSPPYCGITNYRYDNWIRLWMLGDINYPGGGAGERYQDKEQYGELLYNVFKKSRDILKPNGIAYVRTDSRRFTRDKTIEVLSDLFSEHRMCLKSDRMNNSQTRLFGDKEEKPGETDILLLPTKWKRAPKGFRSIST